MFREPFIVVLLVLEMTASVSARLPRSGHLLPQEQAEEGSAADAGYGRWVGRNLGLCLHGDCSIFIGTLQELSGPEPSADLVEGRNQYHSNLIVNVDEWLYREPERWTAKLNLDRVPIAMTRSYGTEFEDPVWSGVRLQAGTRLLIAFHPDASATDAPLDRITRYGLVVSSEGLFPSIRATLEYHLRHTADPDQIGDLPALIRSSADGVFTGYILHYLWTTSGGLHTDIGALVLSQILCDSEIAGGSILHGALIAVMSDADHPLSEGTRIEVTTRLVGASCNEDLSVATFPLYVLATLSEADRVRIRPLLTSSRRERLANNYRALLAAGSMDPQPDFEREIGLQP